MGVQRIRNALAGTPLYPVAKTVYRAYGQFLRYTESVRASGSLVDQSGFYHITPSESGLNSFYIWLPDAKTNFRRECIAGQLEPPVMTTLANHIDENTAFWDIGANRGYFAFACAETVDEVVAFEAAEESVEILNRGVSRNEFDNVTVQPGYVGEDIFLDDFEAPNVVLLDVEGWEYEILDTAPETLASHPRWIVEIHGEPAATDAGSPLPPSFNPEGVLELFDDHGYDITSIMQWSADPERRHILAEPK